MNHRKKSLFVVSLSICLVLLVVLAGCGQAPSQPEPSAPPATASPGNTPVPVQKPAPEPTPPTSAPTPPVTTNLSFPNGAPALNQETELVCKVRTLSISAKNMTVDIKLPEGLILISGELSWVGDVPKGNEVEIIRAIVKSVKTGNWIIEVHHSINPETHGGFGGNYWYPIYIFISEESSQWGITPPWYKGRGVEVPVKKVEAPSSPIKVDLSISEAPLLHSQAKLICMVLSRVDAQNTTVQIKLPLGADLVSGSLTWQGNIKAGEPITFPSQIVFKEPGKWAIEAVAKHVIIPGKFEWGDIDVIYLNIGEDRSEIGWPPTGPVKIERAGKMSDVEPVPSSQEELPVDKFPKPPMMRLDGTIEDVPEHHSITVKGYFYYWTKSGDYRLNPDVQVPANYFLVQLLNGSGTEHRGYGYTNINGCYEIPDVNPTGGIKARFWCYNNITPGYELRVVDSGNTLTGLDNVWHTQYTATYPFPDDGGAHWIDPFILPQGCEGDGAFWIKDDLFRAFQYTPDPKPGRCTVKWTETSTDGSYYDWNGTLQVHLKGVDERAPDIVIHEYGHNVMHNVYNGYWPPGDIPQFHQMNLAYNTGCAWKEGWAEFFPLRLMVMKYLLSRMEVPRI